MISNQTEFWVKFVLEQWNIPNNLGCRTTSMSKGSKLRSMCITYGDNSPFSAVTINFWGSDRFRCTTFFFAFVHPTPKTPAICLYECVGIIQMRHLTHCAHFLFYKICAHRFETGWNFSPKQFWKNNISFLLMWILNPRVMYCSVFSFILQFFTK